jgi:hypothetical protein
MQRGNPSDVGAGYLSFSCEPIKNVPADSFGSGVGFAFKCPDGETGSNNALVQLQRVEFLDVASAFYD